jgi:hypothetical protein
MLKRAEKGTWNWELPDEPSPSPGASGRSTPQPRTFRRAVVYTIAGTDLSGAITAKDVHWKLTRDVNTSILFDFPQVVYEAVEVQPDPSGDPIELAVTCAVEKPPAPTPICTITVQDQTATY